MDNIVKHYETETDIVYRLDSDLHGLFVVPKNLSNNIKVYMLFRDSNSLEKDIVSKMLEITKNINDNGNEGLCIMTLFESDVLNSNNELAYSNLLNKIQNFVNKIYNGILSDGNLTKDNFIKKIELLDDNDEYKNFSEYLCREKPNKFQINSQNNLLQNNTGTTLNPENNLQNNNVINDNYQPTSINPTYNTISEPVEEKLSIGSVPIDIQNSISNNKSLVKTLNPSDRNAAFIKLPTIIFILITSLAVGVGLSIYLLK